MSTPTTARRAQEIALEQIEVGGNVRELDAEHVSALAGSMAVRGLIVPVAVRPLDGDRFALVAGEHRLAAARELGWPTIGAMVSDDSEGASGDQGAENVLRKPLTPLEEARAVEKMLADGYSVDGAATVLGWHKRRVTARQRILELPETAQTLVGSGEIPVAGIEIDALLAIQAISPQLAALVAEVIAEASAEGNPLGAQLGRDPGWLVRQVLSHRPGELFAELAGGTLYEDQVAELKLGKKTTALYAEAKTLHGQLDRYAYGPPPVRIGEAELDQARAAGVLLELDRTQVILDRGVYRELVKTAVARSVEDLRSRATERASDQRERKTASRRERTPHEDADAAHRAQQREFTRRAHNVNLDLGAALLDGLATVDPDNMDVARFYCYGLLGPDAVNYLGTGDHIARTIAANGIRLVLDEQRTTETPTLKGGQPGKTKVTYGEPEDALKWLWKFVLCRGVGYAE